MMKYICSFLCLIFICSCYHEIQGEGSSDLAQDFMIEKFTEVTANGHFKMMLVPNDSAYVSVQSHENLIKNLVIQNDGDELEISEKKVVDGYDEYVVYIYFNDLKEVNVGGKILLESAARIFEEGFQLNVSNNAMVRQFELATTDSEIKASESAQVELTGESVNLKAIASGNSQLKIKELRTKVLDVDLTDQAVVEASVENELKGRILKNAKLDYFGNPSKDVDIKEQGEMNQK